MTRVRARLVTGEVVVGVVVRETSTTSWISCDDGRLMWAYHESVLPLRRRRVG